MAAKTGCDLKSRFFIVTSFKTRTIHLWTFFLLKWPSCFVFNLAHTIFESLAPLHSKQKSFSSKNTITIYPYQPISTSTLQISYLFIQFTHSSVIWIKLALGLRIVMPEQRRDLSSGTLRQLKNMSFLEERNHHHLLTLKKKTLVHMCCDRALFHLSSQSTLSDRLVRHSCRVRTSAT